MDWVMCAFKKKFKNYEIINSYRLNWRHRRITSDSHSLTKNRRSTNLFTFNSDRTYTYMNFGLHEKNTVKAFMTIGID